MLNPTIAAESNLEEAPAGGISALVQGITSKRAPLTNQARSRTLYRPRTSQLTQKLPCTATAVFKTEKNLQIKAAVAVQGSSGR